MTRLRATIDSRIHLLEDDLPDPLRRQIVGELTIINGAKIAAQDQLVQTAYLMDDVVRLWSSDEHLLFLPRGFAHRLEELAQQFGESIEWASEMTLIEPSEHLFRDWPAASLRGYQADMRDAMLDWAQGVVQCDTGGGKSRAAAEFIRWSGQRSLIVVGTTSLARQWEKAFDELYGYQVGFVGEGQRDFRDVTVGLWQSLHRSENRDELKNFGVVITDEVHRSSADQISKLLQTLPAFYRIGLSATPRWDEFLWPIVQAVVGPVIYQVPSEELEEHLIDPEVRLLESSFSAEYLPARREGRKRISNNYTDIMTELVEDEDRNRMIVEIASYEADNGHHVLIQTSRIEHVRRLTERLRYFLNDDQILVLTGNESGARSEQIRQQITESIDGTVLVTTVAKEGFDAVRLDRLILAYPLRKLPLVEQIAGRIRRRAEGKDSAVIYDVVDPGCGVLASQAKDRQKLFYQRRWQVTEAEKPTVA